MKITISGTSASGKSSVARIVAKKLGLKHYSMGDMQRELAKELGVDIVELGKLEAKDKRYDLMQDEKLRKLGEENDFVIDTWLGAKFVPQALNVFIDADIDVRAKRRLSHRREGDSHESLDMVKKNILEREKDNRERWIRYYGFDFSDKAYYDLVIDSTNLSIEEVTDKIIERAKAETLNIRRVSTESTASGKK